MNQTKATVKELFVKCRKYYKFAQQTHPYVVQGLQTGLVMGTGDIVAQTIIENRTTANYAYLRTGKFAFLGLIFVGPFWHYYFRFLNQQICAAANFQRAFCNMLVDRCILHPFYIVVMTSTVSSFHDNDRIKIIDNVKDNLKDIMITNCCVYPAVQMLNFFVIPVNFRAIFLQSLAMIWNTYFRWRTSKHV